MTYENNNDHDNEIDENDSDRDNGDGKDIENLTDNLPNTKTEL